MEETIEGICRDLSSFRLQRSDFKIEKMIAQGGFGKVYLASLVQNGSKCAFKELICDNNDERQIQLFAREVRILAMCDNYFLLPFVGFIPEHPFSMITEFIPNGSLYDALHSNKNQIQLDGTNKTIIAMGIACGLARLHSLNIIHRDMKSLNILLDSKLFPRICDFGISRFGGDPNAAMTQQIGTPHWMAPEMFESANYTNKVDVYAYAILLWEVLTQQTPFKGMSAIQIMTGICTKRERPAIPPNTPSSLRKLIQACWHQNPESRPSFEKVFKLFESHKVKFEGCDDAKVTAALQEITSSAQFYGTRGLIMSGAPTFSRPAIEQTVSSVSPSSNPTSTSIFNILVSGNNSLIEAQMKLITAQTCQFFFEALWHLLTNVRQPEYVKPALIALLKILVMNNDVLADFVNRQLYLSLPFDTQDNMNISLSILLPVFEKHPNNVTADLIKIILPCLSLAAVKIIRLFAVYCESFDNIENPWQVADILILRAEDFINGGASIPLIQILYRLLVNHDVFYEGRRDNCAAVFVRCLSSNTFDCVKTAYSALIAIRVPILTIDPELLVSHLSIDNIALDVLELLSVSPLNSLSYSLIQRVAAYASLNEIGAHALCRMVSSNQGAASFLDAASIWLSPDTLAVENQLRVLLIILSFPDFRPIVATHPLLFEFLYRSTSKNDIEIHTAIASMIRRLPFSASDVDQLSQHGFIESYISKTIEFNDYNGVVHCFLLIDMLSRIRFVPEYLKFLSCVLGTIQTTPQLHSYALSYLLLMCMSPTAIEELKRMRVADVLRTVTVQPELNQYMNDLLSTLG